MTDLKSCGIVFDSHFHLNGGHDWSGPVKEFIKAGGTAVNLVNLPDYSISIESYYELLYERTLRVADSLSRDYGLHVILSLGPYPLDYFHFMEAGKDPEKSMLEGLELAARYIGEGRAHGFGEIGRPHFEVSSEILDFSNSFIMKAFELARDLGTYAMLHTEDLDRDSMHGIAEMGRKAGIDRSRVIKHHATPDILDVEPEIPKTILATRPNTRIVMESSNRAMLESDFVDDPEKPGKVIPADSVPRRATMIRNSALDYEKILSDIFEDIPYLAFRDDYFKP